MRQPDEDRPELRYVERLRAALGGMPPAECDDIAREVESHIAEARSRGDDIAALIARLGPPERLAGAYRAEALLDRGRGNTGRLEWLAAGALLATTSVVSLMVVPLLALAGILLTPLGALTVLLALGSFAFPEIISSAVLSTYPPGTSLGQILGLVMGALAVAAGLLAIRALRAYLRFAARSLRSRLLADLVPR